MHAFAFVLFALVGKAGSPQLFMPAREVTTRYDGLAWVEDVAVTPSGEVALWCEGLHAINGACYAYTRDTRTLVSLFDADELTRGTRRYVVVDGKPVDRYGFSAKFIRCERSVMAVMLHGVPSQSRLLVSVIDRTPAGFGQTPSIGNNLADPCVTPALGTIPWGEGALAVWPDCSGETTAFRLLRLNKIGRPDGSSITLPPCCPTRNTPFAVLKMPRLAFVLLYSGRTGRGLEGISELVMYADDFTSWREFAISPDAPRHIDAAALDGWNHVIVWDDKRGVHAAIGEIAKPMQIVTLSATGTLPAVATDGKRALVTWLDGNKVMAAGLASGEASQPMIVDRDAMTAQPFVKALWVPGTGFVVYWRQGSDPKMLALARQPLDLVVNEPVTSEH